jgi:hypothetical protein
MSRKHNKKRNKPYRGDDYVPDQPVVHHYTAVVRSPFGEWWQANKRTVRIVSLIGGGVIVFVYLIYELIRLIF